MIISDRGSAIYLANDGRTYFLNAGPVCWSPLRVRPLGTEKQELIGELSDF